MPGAHLELEHENRAVNEKNDISAFSHSRDRELEQDVTAPERRQDRLEQADLA